MKQLLTTGLALCAIMSASNGKAQNANPVYRNLPPNSEKVFHINLAVLGPKANWAAMLNKIPMGKGKNDQKYMELLKNSSTTGVDLKQDVFIAQSPMDPTDSSRWTTVIFHITDSAKLISSIKQMGEELHYYKFADKGRAEGHGHEGFAYTDRLAVVTSYDRPATVKAKAGAPNIARLAAEKSLQSLKGYDNSFFTTDAKFQSMFGDDADFHMMTEGGTIREALLKLSKKAKLGLNSKSLAGMPTGSTHNYGSLRFDIGKIVFKTTSPLDANTLSQFGAVAGTPLNTDLLARVPGGDLLGMADMHFNPSGLVTLLDQYNLRKKLDSGLTKIGLSTQEILQTFKGDFVISATQGAEGKPGIYFTTTINDPAAWRKLADKIGFKSEDGKTDEGSVKTGKTNAYFRLKDNALVVSSNQEAVDAYFNNTTKRDLPFVNDRLRTSIFSLYVDMKTVGSFLQNAKGDNSGKAAQLAFVTTMLQSISFNVATLNGSDSETWFEIKMANQDQNALTTISNLFN